MDATSPLSDSEEAILRDVQKRREEAYRRHLRQVFWDEVFNVADPLQSGIDTALKIDRVAIAIDVMRKLTEELKELSDGML